MTARVIAIIVALFVAAAARAQTAPAGNAHPAAQAVSGSGTKPANPFGEAIPAAPIPVDQKLVFASQLDLSPLRTLAVQHDGRVKILDTLARETIFRITGRRAYQDFPQGLAAGKKVGYDPLFTLLDLLIDPSYYFDKPLIHIEYRPLQEMFLTAAFPDQPGEQLAWLRNPRLSPIIVSRYGDPLNARHDLDASYRQALNHAADALEIFQLGGNNLLLVAPATTDSEYQHLATLPLEHPARQAAAALGAAWRTRDAAAANSAILSLASELPKINPSVYPAARRDIELAYNKTNAFEWGYWMYALALLTLILAFGTGRKPLIAVGITTLTLAVSLHAFGFITRCIIAERFAIQNQFESMTGVSLFAAIVGLSIMLLKRQYLYGAAAAGVGFLVLITATQTAIPGKFIEREAAILNTSVLLKYHVTTVLCSYGLISLGFIVSLFYLGTYYAAKFRSGKIPDVASSHPTSDIPHPTPSLSRHSAPVLAATALNLPESAPRGTARTLTDLDKAQLTVLQLAFWTLGVGILLGAWWADHSWGRWWGFDPKETWALATWIIYLIVIHLRFTTAKHRALTTAWLSVVGFIVMLWTYFGVNLLLPGLHAYA